MTKPIFSVPRTQLQNTDSSNTSSNSSHRPTAKSASEIVYALTDAVNSLMQNSPTIVPMLMKTYHHSFAIQGKSMAQLYNALELKDPKRIPDAEKLLNEFKEFQLDRIGNDDFLVEAIEAFSAKLLKTPIDHKNHPAQVSRLASTSAFLLRTLDQHSDKPRASNVNRLSPLTLQKLSQLYSQALRSNIPCDPFVQDALHLSEKSLSEFHQLITDVQENARAFESACEEFKNNEDVVTAVVQSRGAALQYTSDKFKDDPKIVMAAVQQYGWVLQYASDELKNNPEIVMAAVQEDGIAIKFASDEFKNNPKFVLAAVQRFGWALQYASDELKNDPKFLMEAVQKNGDALEYTSDELKNDPEIVMAAVQQDSRALKFASDELKNDPKIVMAAVQDEGMALKFASDELKNDPKIVMEAVQKNRFALEYASYKLRNDPTIVMAARSGKLHSPYVRQRYS